MLGCLTFIVFILAVAALTIATQLWSRIKNAEREIARLQKMLDRLRWEDLERATTAEKPIAPPEPPPPTLETPIPEPVPEPEPELVSEPAFEPPPPPITPPSPRRPFDWEGLVGVKLFSWIAGILLVLAAVFFLKYSVDQGWLNPTVRVVIGLATGMALIIVCELRVARDYRATANAMHGAAIAILYATLFAMHARWHLASAGVAFFGMLLVTAVAVYLSIRRNSVLIALLGLLGGFATPALLSTGENRPIVLFSYLFLLNAGLAGVAYWKRWPALTALSVLLTAIYQWGWIAKFLDTSQVPLAAGIFIVFAVLAAAGLWFRRRDEADEQQVMFDRVATAGASLPLFFAIFTAAMPAYGARFNTLFGFLLLVAAGLAGIAWKRGPAWLNLLGGLVVLITWAVWLSASYTSAAWPTVLAWATAFIVLYLVSRQAVIGALLFFVFPALAAIEPATDLPALLFAVTLILLAGVGVYAIRSVDARTFYIAAGFTIGGLAVWTARHLDGVTAGSALTIYTTFAFVALAVSVGAHKFERAIAPEVALAAYGFLIVVAGKRSLGTPPLLLLSALVAIGVAVAVVAFHLRRSSLLTGSVVGGQIVLMAWANATTRSPWPYVALAAALAVAVVPLIEFALDRRFITSGATALVLGHFVALVVSTKETAPLTAVVATHVVLLIALLVVAWLINAHELATIDVFITALATLLANTKTPGQEAAFAAAIYAPFIAYPLLLGRRVRDSIQPHLAAVLASVAFFFFARHAIYDANLDAYIGALPLLQAGLMGLLLWQLVRIEPPAERKLSRLALVAAAALAFVTVAIPLQLDKEWITIAWGLEAAALVWLFRRVPHEGLLLWADGLFIIVFVRLVLNPAVFAYHAKSTTPIVNWYLYTYLVPAAAFFAAAYLAPRHRKIAISLFNAAGTVLLFVLLNVEIADFYSIGETLTFNFISSSLAQDLTYTIGWALFAIGMLIAGIALSVRAARIAALVLLLVTILKCFLHDLARLGGLYRVGSLLGLAVSLVIVGLLLQKFVMAKSPPAAEETP